MSDWEPVNADPLIFRNRNRGGLWLVDGKLQNIPGVSLGDLIALQKSIDEINNPPAAEPAKPAPPERHDYPRWIVPHESHITQLNNAPNIFVSGFKFDVNRDTNVVTVLVRNETEEARALAPKRKY